MAWMVFKQETGTRPAAESRDLIREKAVGSLIPASIKMDKEGHRYREVLHPEALNGCYVKFQIIKPIKGESSGRIRGGFVVVSKTHLKKGELFCLSYKDEQGNKVYGKAWTKADVARAQWAVRDDFVSRLKATGEYFDKQ